MLDSLVIIVLDVVAIVDAPVTLQGRSRRPTVGNKNVDCLARQKRRNMSERMNKAFTEPKRVEKCTLDVDEEGLVVKMMTHEVSQVLNRSESSGSSMGAQIMMQYL
ncbi:hypothetical protein DY000_02039020 [Brassica cretica]|uniref:BHLH domain-containing protein n=1 Tax=Brassica cretica TaxID=69181 RepID=A0ABQ7BCZ1_BRACR|nr:hypothetical protein DY000_02039020 [Brassica cretica]